MALLKYNDKYHTMNRKRFNKGNDKSQRKRGRHNKKTAHINYEMRKAA